MYCMYCGKWVDGSVPICPECLQSDSAKHPVDSSVLERTHSEAKPFYVKKEIAKQEQNTPVVQTKQDVKFEEKDATVAVIIMWVFVFMVCVILVALALNL